MKLRKGGSGMSRNRRRTWVKLHVTGWLHGSIRWQFSPEERGVWADLLALGGELGQDGKFCDNDGRALPWDFIANSLNIRKALLETVVNKSLEEGRLKEKDGVFILSNWSYYQSEYDRQKKYR